MVFRSSRPDQVDDFRISISLAGSLNQLTLEAGDAREAYTIPFSREDVEAALDDSAPNRVLTDPLTSFGSTLFSSLFHGTVGRQFWGRFADAEAANRGLRLRIFTSLERVQHIPWELLFDPSRRDFMSLSGRLALVRTRQEGYSDELMRPLTQVRILAAAADVTGEMDAHKDLEILRNFENAHPSLVKLDIVERTTSQELRARLVTNSYDIFHFAGTGEVLAESKRGGIRQELRIWGSSPSDSYFGRHQLGRLLQNAGVRLAVLNASHSDWVSRSLARYIPAVLGHREDIWAEGAVALCESLYPLLISSIPLDLAVTAVRQAVDRSLPGTGQWCKIILYLQRPNGFLFLDPESGTDGTTDLPRPEKRDKERTKLFGLLSVYERNLNAIEKLGSAAATSRQETIQELRRKIDDVKRQMQTGY